MTTKVPVELSSTPGIADSSNATAITIDSSEKVGIGAAPTLGALHVTSSLTDIVTFENTDAGTTGAQLILYHNSSSPADGDRVGALNFKGQDDAGNDATYAGIRCLATDVSNTTEDGTLTFSTTRAGTFTEAMRINESGNVGIGTTSITSSTGWSPKLVLSDTSAGLILKGINSQECNIGVSNGLYLDALGSTTASNNMIIFRTSNTNSNFSAAIRMAIDSSGSITMNNLYGSAADQNDVRYNASSGLLFYNTSSRRYKENIKDMPDGVLDKIKQARVVTFDEKGTDVSSYGLIAEELDELIPELVTRKEIDGELVPESIVYSKIGVWVLKAMQEQQTIIEDLKARIETLEG